MKYAALIGFLCLGLQAMAQTAYQGGEGSGYARGRLEIQEPAFPTQSLAVGQHRPQGFGWEIFVDIAGLKNTGTIEVVDVRGRILYTQAVTATLGERISLALDLSSGVYIIRLRTDATTLTRKIHWLNGEER